MRHFSAVLGLVIILFVAGSLVWLLGSSDLPRSGYLAAHLLDVVMGIFCLAWLFVVLKVPWDLYFQARAVAFEQQRAKEQKIVLAPGREAYIVSLRPKLLWLAIGSHLLSAIVVGTVTWFSHGRVGYYFAAFYLLSTVFRPAVAGYQYLAERLQAIGEEAHYPREDILEMKERVFRNEISQRDLTSQLQELRDEQTRAAESLNAEAVVREEENRVIRQGLHNLSREFESTVSRLTDNREVIQGIQAFVRLIAQSTQHPA